jgi:hypothetical protein
MKSDEHLNNGRDKDRQDDGKDHGHEHRHEPKPEPPGRIVHPRPSHGDSGAR